MTKQFKHESDDYIPLLDNGKIYIRPDWMPYDELFVGFVNPLNKNDIMQKFVKINSLTKEEFIKYQKAGRIPADYKIEEWIRGVDQMLKSAIYGFAVGDALGVPFEFKKRGTFTCEGMTGYGSWNQAPGTWSDDTSMTLATLDSIKERGCIDPDDMRRRFCDWLYQSAYTANGETFDVGTTTRIALEQGQGLDDYHANGNGSLMRILPLAFTEATDDEIRAVSAITHAHKLSTEACVEYVHLARQLIRGETLRMDEIKTKRAEDIQSTGFVLHTLEASIWCLLTTASYREAVCTAVNLGDDTDTTAAVVGGLAGIKYGFDSIPKEWIDQLKNKALIDSILNK